MDKKYIAVPGRLESVATDGQIAGANQVFDDNLEKNQAEINADIIARLEALEGNT